MNEARHEAMRSVRRRNPVVGALYVNAAVLGVIGWMLMGRGGGSGRAANGGAMLGASGIGASVAMGQYQPPIAGGAGIFVMPAQFSMNTWGCYLLDVDRQTLCAYEFFPGDKELRLIAARNYIYDRQLKDFNTAPSPVEVHRLVEEEKRSGRVIGSHGDAPEPEAPPKDQ